MTVANSTVEGSGDALSNFFFFTLYVVFSFKTYKLTNNGNNTEDLDDYFDNEKHWRFFCFISFFLLFKDIFRQVFRYFEFKDIFKGDIGLNFHFPYFLFYFLFFIVLHLVFWHVCQLREAEKNKTRSQFVMHCLCLKLCHPTSCFNLQPVSM